MSSEPSIFFADPNQRQGAFLRRTVIFGGLTAFGGLALSGRLAQLQMFQANDFRNQAAANQYDFRMVLPPRGRILDREGVVIASNRPSFRVLIVKDDLTGTPEETLDLLGRLLPDTLERRRQLLREIEAAPGFAPVPVKSDLTWEEFAEVNLHASELPGVMADMNEARSYPFSGTFAHVIGYVAKPNAEDLKAEREREGGNPELILNPGFRIGRQGIEKSLDMKLRGTPGGTRVEVDHRGRIVAEDVGGSKPAVAGEDVVLTLDADIQQRALEVFGEESGACVVMDIRNGDVLCMASSPAFDPNLFVSGVPGAVYRAWAEYERKPLLDKAIGSIFHPGSTFKMTTALALLEAGVDPKERVLCRGGIQFGSRFFRCHSTHGLQDMHNAIKNSCDSYFYALCNRAGVDRIQDVGKRIGFMQTYDIGIGSQKTGRIPSKAWKAEYNKNNPNPDSRVWQPGETLSVSIGQGDVNVTALQLAVMVSRIANTRKAVTPRLIKSVGGVERPNPSLEDLTFPPEHLEIIREGMNAVANDRSGGAYRTSQLGLGDLKMSGKTGTAQVSSYDRRASRKSSSVGWALKDHNLYVAFAPTDAPRYGIAVIVEHGGQSGSTAAAPRAREVMKTTLLKDPDMVARIQRPLPPEGTAPADAPMPGAAPEPPIDAVIPQTGTAAPAAPSPVDTAPPALPEAPTG